MDWLNSMNAAIDYIETHLADEISYDRAAQIACCSTYHFQRMFSTIAGVPLSEYIRRRRLTLAAFELQAGNRKVIDTALKYGYESPEAFSRAFKRQHGTMPMLARDTGVALKADPRMSFHITIEGDAEMIYRIEEKGAFEVFGLELQTNVIDGQCFKDIPDFWEVCENDGRCVALEQAAGKKPNELLDAGVTYDHNPNGDMKYMIGCIKRPGTNAAGYTLLSIQKQTWVVFSVAWAAEDDTGLHQTWRRIYSEWFPSASYEHADCDFELEIYFGDSDAAYGVEIWIPVTKK